MTNISQVNPQVINAVSSAQEATMISGVIGASGAGKAYQSVAQSSAIAIQDATDHLRNISTISATAVGAAMAQLLSQPESAQTYKEIIEGAQGLVGTAADNFKKVGENAAKILKDFPTN